MKTNLFRTVADWLLATSVILSVVLFIQFYFRTHEARKLQQESLNLQQFRARVNLLLGDVMEYSKRNPAINPVLEPFIKPPSAPAAAPKPAVK